MDQRATPEPPMFHCPVCNADRSVIYMDSLPGVGVVCCECHIEHFHIAVVRRRWEGYSPRARRVWALRCMKWKVKDIARELGVTPKTVERETQRYGKWLIKTGQLVVHMGKRVDCRPPDRPGGCTTGNGVGEFDFRQAASGPVEVFVS